MHITYSQLYCYEIIILIFYQIHALIGFLMKQNKINSIAKPIYMNFLNSFIFNWHLYIE